MQKQKNEKEITTSGVKSWAEWFDKSARHYQNPLMKMAYYLNGKTGTPVPDDIMDATHKDIWKKLSAEKHHTVLDVGCGVGFITQKYRGKVKRIIGTDASPTMILDAISINPNDKFLVCRADSLPFSKSYFDRILCYGVFHYLSDECTAQLVLDEFMKVIKDDGKILIGDILEPIDNKQSDNDSKNSNATSRWWPSDLNHNLEKLMLDRSFFLNFCKMHNRKCDILKQDIPSRQLPSPRYDVLIGPKL